MSEELTRDLADELERIKQLSLEEQPAAFELLRQRLEQLLNSGDSAER